MAAGVDAHLGAGGGVFNFDSGDVEPIADPDYGRNRRGRGGGNEPE